MLSSQSDPKDLPDWLELDYFRRRRPLARWRRRLVRGALGAGALLCVLLLLPPFLGPRALLPVYESRPVSTAHAMFNDDCAQCHTESFRPLGRLVHGDDVRSVDDATCLRCHDGASHHHKQTHTPDCASCHREHLGRPALARVPDADCAACHADLKTRSGKAAFAANVASFPDRHPEFGRWQEGAKDTGTVRFNHQVHLQPDGVLVPGSGDKPERRKLDCTACHQADAAGRFMRPINYERHCAECHPLGVRVSGETKDDKARRAAEEFARAPAPHRAPDVVRAVLRQRFTDFALAHRVGGDRLAPEVPQSPLPGPRRAPPITEEQWHWVGRELAQAEKLLFDGPGGCAYCHAVEERAGAKGLPVYRKSSLPERWFPHSRFGHTAHRMLSCVSCHAGAPASAKTADVLMPTKETCQQCHAPRGGARHDCAECHLYHDPKAGRGLNGHLTLESLGK